MVSSVLVSVSLTYTHKWQVVYTTSTTSWVRNPIFSRLYYYIDISYFTRCHTGMQGLSPWPPGLHWATLPSKLHPSLSLSLCLSLSLRYTHSNNMTWAFGQNATQSVIYGPSLRYGLCIWTSVTDRREITIFWHFSLQVLVTTIRAPHKVWWCPMDMDHLSL